MEFDDRGDALAWSRGPLAAMVAGGLLLFMTLLVNGMFGLLIVVSLLDSSPTLPPAELLPVLGLGVLCVGIPVLLDCGMSAVTLLAANQLRRRRDPGALFGVLAVGLAWSVVRGATSVLLCSCLSLPAHGSTFLAYAVALMILGSDPIYKTPAG